MKIVLFRPDIPQNTGNIGRTCVALGASLVLVRPLGFSLSDKMIKRSGMDYWDRLDLSVVDSLEEAISDVPSDQIFLLSTQGEKYYARASLPLSGAYIFGSESQGVTREVHEKFRGRRLLVPMLDGTRSLNLATTVGVVMYEVVRQNYDLWGRAS
ncbi:tRNA (cytidine(34)-2'-O)-methyltransferase [Chlamydiifrater phoenicopteri]|uniref:tRNA (cytidine(34)-2'-O)-methyltransferase n=1 Tax=Chlamydiifrater phoenicopteri TaxID=2681469 RepID=UPI001BCF9991|nr:tRNA (cytidine(34)-2'-O)-methyltransferase [Chlamydiifrater phoenicopteri]